MLGAGSAAIGASALVGSGAFTSVASERTVSVRAANDENAYLGLKEVPHSPNSSYVDYNDNGQLRIQMDDANPNHEDEKLGTGVNTNSLTNFKDLFRIKNQGTQPIHVFAFLQGDKPNRVGLFGSDYSPCWGLKLDVGEYEDIGLRVDTWDVEGKDNVSATAQLVENMYIVAVGEENPEGDKTHEDAAWSYVPDDDAEASEALPDGE